jgi:hypothetical protein
MMRLIDADALIAEHCSGCSEDIRTGCKTDPVCATLMWFEDAPTIDAVPVEQVKAQVIDIVKSFEVLVGCTGVGVITKAIERMETPSPYITL